MTSFKQLTVISGAFAFGFGASQLWSAAAAARDVYVLAVAIDKQNEQEHPAEQSIAADYQQESQQMRCLIATARRKH